MNPDEAKKQLQQVETDRAFYRSRMGTIDDTRPIAEGISDARVDEILTVCHDLIAEVERLESNPRLAEVRGLRDVVDRLECEKAELERLICIGCGGRQTSEQREYDKDCPCGGGFMTLEGAVRHHQAQAVNLQAEVESLQRADIRNYEIMASYAEEKAELEARLDAQQKVLDAFGHNADAVRELVTEIIEQRGWKEKKAELECNLKVALESADSMKAAWNAACHDIEILKIKLAVHNLCHGPEDCPQVEFEEKMCGVRGALEETVDKLETLISRGDIAPDDVKTTREWQNRIKQALSSAPQCPHKEEAEKLRDWLRTNAIHGSDCKPDKFCDCGLKELLK